MAGGLSAERVDKISIVPAHREACIRVKEQENSGVRMLCSEVRLGRMDGPLRCDKTGCHLQPSAAGRVQVEKSWEIVFGSTAASFRAGLITVTG
jgi:hypothetical protein